MKIEKLRRTYAAPTAEIVCLAPAAPIASWKWTGGSSNSKWNESSNNWFAEGVPDILGNASVTGLLTWANEDELN